MALILGTLVSVVNQIHYLSSIHFNSSFIAPKCDSECTFYFKVAVQFRDILFYFFNDPVKYSKCGSCDFFSNGQKFRKSKFYFSRPESFAFIEKKYVPI